MSQDDIGRNLKSLLFWTTPWPESALIVPDNNLSRFGSEMYEVDTAAIACRLSIMVGLPFASQVCIRHRLRFPCISGRLVCTARPY